MHRPTQKTILFCFRYLLDSFPTVVEVIISKLALQMEIEQSNQILHYSQISKLKSSCGLDLQSYPRKDDKKFTKSYSGRK
mmetsp:Transcript_25731/g.28780  ORF Transcript_25731/g.28780 Transcript_25731/m.28780 type:complete len:80 (+) Transcript_25731:1709-1948(+)